MMIYSSIVPRHVVCDRLNCSFGFWQTKLLYGHLITSGYAMEGLMEPRIDYPERLFTAVRHLPHNEIRRLNERLGWLMKILRPWTLAGMPSRRRPSALRIDTRSVKRSSVSILSVSANACFPTCPRGKRASTLACVRQPAFGYRFYDPSGLSGSNRNSVRRKSSTCKLSMLRFGCRLRQNLATAVR
jgi:hypothetical protein